MKLKTTVVVVLAVAAILCGTVLTALQSRVPFNKDLQNWYITHAHEVTNEAWLLARGFEKSDVLGAHADTTAYHLSLSTAGGYSTVTVFLCKNGDVSFKAESDVLDERFVYQYTVWLGDREHMWINVHADTQKLADDAVTQIIEALQ